MRLGKRERAQARAKATIRRKPAPVVMGVYTSMWSRLQGAGRPVGKPANPWHWNWKHARRIKLQGLNP
jgi:hypothetical protein